MTFALFGFILGLWADGFEKLQIVPLMVISPLTFLGGTFYSIDMLPPFWRKVALLNPVVYLVDGFRWAFYGIAAVGPTDQLRHDPRHADGLRRHRRLDLQDRLPPAKLGVKIELWLFKAQPAKASVARSIKR